MLTQKNIFLQNFTPNLLLFCIFQLFSIKNTENDYFSKRLGCAAPKRWSKYAIEPLDCHSFCLLLCLNVIHYICPSLLLSSYMSIISSSDCSSAMLSICPFYPFIYLSARPFICYAVCLFASLPPYLNSYKPFLTLSDQYPNPEQGFETRSWSESLLKFDTRSKPLGHHSRFMFVFIYVSCT